MQLILRITVSTTLIMAYTYAVQNNHMDAMLILLSIIGLLFTLRIEGVW